jgi:hypothetical protein
MGKFFHGFNICLLKIRTWKLLGFGRWQKYNRKNDFNLKVIPKKIFSSKYIEKVDFIEMDFIEVDFRQRLLDPYLQ